MSGSREEGSSLLERIDARLAKAEAVLVVVVLGVMVALSTLQLVLHALFDTGIEWADIVVRQMVLWLGFIGGALATHEGRHIAIDALGKFLSPRPAAAFRVLSSLAALVISGIMFWASFVFVKEELAAESTIFGGVPAWPFELIMPIALAAIVFHFFVTAVISIQVARGKRAAPIEREGSVA